MRNRQKVKNSSRDRKAALRLLVVVMVVFLLSGCGARTGAADVSAPKSAQIEGESDAAGHAQLDGGDSDKSSSDVDSSGADQSAAQPSEVRAAATDLQSFSELSEIPDGSYWIRVSMTGGSGRASISSPTGFYVKDGQATADIHWSSASYDYMKLDGVRYDAFTDAAGHSVMTIPVSALDTAISVLADTTAMSKPYEIEYQLTFDGSALLPMADASMAEAHALPTDVLQRTLSSATAQVADAKSSESSVQWSAAPEIEGLTFISSEKNDVAEYFRLSLYEDASGMKYQLLETAGGLHRYLIVPVDAQVSEQKSGRFTARASEANRANKEKKGDVLELTVLQQPLTTTYVAASAVMAPICDLGAVSQIRFSGLREEGWYVDAARTAMKEGAMLFAGKYSEPDYETLLREGCDLALESTMIYRSPEVIEKLTALGIPVYIDYSSYEPHVLGRLEWIRVYGALFGHAQKAQQCYASERDRIRAIQKDAEKDGPTVVYFYVNASGQIQVRQPHDYIPELIELAGARYLAPDMSGLSGSRKSNVTVSVEDFYSSCRNADYLIYSATLDRPLSSIQELLGKNALFADFKAVQEGHVYTTDKDFYQLSDRMADFAEDVRRMLQGQGDMHFLKKVS